MTENIAQLHARILPQELAEAAIELGPYLLDAYLFICSIYVYFFNYFLLTVVTFGNPTRLDYGTGHELHFVVWTYCLRTLNVLKQSDESSIVLNIFPR